MFAVRAQTPVELQSAFSSTFSHLPMIFQKMTRAIIDGKLEQIILKKPDKSTLRLNKLMRILSEDKSGKISLDTFKSIFDGLEKAGLFQIVNRKQSPHIRQRIFPDITKNSNPEFNLLYILCIPSEEFNEAHLTLAMNAQQAIVVEQILRKKNFPQITLCEVLHWASQYGHVNLIQYLLDPQRDHFKTDDIEDALLVACKGGHASTVRCLLQARSKKYHSWQKLMLASSSGHEAIAMMFLQPPFPKLILHFAAKLGQMNVVTELLKLSDTEILELESYRISGAGCKVSGYIPLELAMIKGHVAIARAILIRYLAAQPKNLNDVLMRISITGDLELFKQYFSQADVSDETKVTLLLTTCKYGQQGIALFLIQSGVNIAAGDSTGMTALHFAAQFGLDDVVQALLKANATKAFIDAQCEFGMTALMLACLHQKSTTALLLLNLGASLNLKSISGETALHYAAENGLEAVVNEMLNKGCSDILDVEGLLPLSTRTKECSQENDSIILVKDCFHWTIPIGDLTLEQYRHIFSHTITQEELQETPRRDKRLEITVQDFPYVDRYRKSTALHLACIRGHSNVAKLLIQKGASISKITESGDTAIHWAARLGLDKVVESIFSRAGFQRYVDITNKDGYNPFMIACIRGDAKITWQLLAYSHMQDYSDINRDTCLHWAVLNELEDIITKIMWVYRDEINRMSSNGFVPLEIASQVGNAYIAQSLIEFGAKKVNKSGEWINLECLFNIENIKDKEISNLVIVNRSQGDARFLVRRSILSERSTYFKVLLEALPKRMTLDFPIQTVSIKALELLLRFLYSGSIQIPYDQFKEIASLAMVCEISELQMLCKIWLWQYPECESWSKYLNLDIAEKKLQYQRSSGCSVM